MSAESKPAPRVEPLAVAAKQAASMCGVSTAMWWKMKNSGRCPAPVKLGRRLLWRVEDLRQWVADGCPAPSAWKAAQYRRETAQSLSDLPKKGAA